MLTPGQTIAHYEIEFVAGTGGMGVVYRARDLRLGRPVALKLVAPQLAQDRITRERLNRESTIVAGIDHPNVIPLYEAGEADGALFLASRWVEGRELGEVVAQDGPLPPERAARLVGQVASALTAAHRAGLVHRDVKPSNALVTPHDHVYLTDFGIARRGSDVSGLTETSQLLGTLDYVAPEQIKGEEVDVRTDVYALGGLLHHALTGHPPFAQRSAAATLFAHLSADPPRPSDVDPTIPPALDAVVARAMAKEPADRYQSARDFEAELHTAVGAPGRRTPRTGEYARRDLQAAEDGPRSAALDADDAGVDADVDAGLRDAGDGGVLTPAGGIAVAPSPVARSASAAERDAAGPASATPDRGPIATEPAPARRRRRSRLRTLLVCAAVLVAALVPAALLLGLVRDERAGVETTSVGPGGTGVAVLGTRAWVGVTGSDRVLGVPLDDLHGAPGRLGVDAPVSALAARGDRLLVGTRGALTNLPGASGSRAQRVALPITPRLLAAGSGTSWATPGGERKELVRVQGARVDVITLSDPANGLATSRGVLWITHAAAGTLGRTDARTGRFVGITRLGGAPTGVAATSGAVWVSDPERDRVLRIDPATGKPVGAPIPVPGNPGAIAADSREVWVVRKGDDAVTKLDARTGRPLDEVGTAREPVGVALGPDAAWVVGRGGQLTRIPR